MKFWRAEGDFMAIEHIKDSPVLPLTRDMDWEITAKWKLTGAEARRIKQAKPGASRRTLSAYCQFLYILASVTGHCAEKYDVKLFKQTRG